MGDVYEALDRERGESVALKTLRHVDANGLLRLKNEFRALQGVTHQNLVKLGELFFEEGHWFFTMELLDGESFIAWARPGEAAAHRSRGFEATAHEGEFSDEAFEEPPDASAGFDVARLRGALSQLVLGLSALHRSGLVHRDIKPSNILVESATGRLVLLDFSLITEDHRPTGITQAEHVVGTASYMAPEQATGSGEVGPATDWYAMGVVLYESLTGRLPFAGSALDVIRAKQVGRPASPRSLVPSVPEDLDRICAALLSPDSADRPDGAAIRHALRIAEERGSMSSIPRVSFESPQFLGRTSELGQLRRAALKSRDQAVVLVVQGESGVGKSALVRHFADEIAMNDAGTWMFHGRCYERESVPYKAFDGIVDALSLRLSRLSDEEAAAYLPADAALLTRVFPVLRRVPVMLRASQKTMAVPDAAQLRSRAFEALRDLFTRISAQRPLVLVMDDLQWADIDSVHLLGELLHPPGEPSMLVLATQRAGPEGREVSELLARTLAELRDVRRLQIGALPHKEATELVMTLARRTLGERDIDAATIAREAGGHPLYIHELLHHLATDEEGSTGSAVRLDEALWARISRFEGAPWLVLRVACVAGAPLQIGSCAAACEMELSELHKHVSVLRVAHLVRTTGLRGTDMLEAYHDRIRESVLSHLSSTEMADLHRRIADALEIAGADTRDPQALLRHLMAAGEHERASYLAEKAAFATATALAFEQAAEFFRIALGLGNPPIDERRRLFIGLGEALAGAGRSAEAAEAFLEAAEGAFPVERLECRRRAADLYLSSGHVNQGMRILEEVLDEVNVTLPATPKKALWSLIGAKLRLLLRGNRFTPRTASESAPSDFMLLDIYETVALNMAMMDNIVGADFEHRAYLQALKLGEPRRVAKSMLWHAMWAGSVGPRARKKGFALIASAREMLPGLEDPLLDALAATAEALLTYFGSEFATAIPLLSRSEEALSNHTLRARWEHDNVRLFRCICLRYVGRYADLRRDHERLFREATQRGDEFLRTVLRRAMNIVCLVADEPERAQKDLDEAWWVPPDRAYHLQHWYELRARAELAIYTGTTTDFVRSSKADFSALTSSMLLRVQNIRIDERSLMGRLALAQAGEGHEPEAGLDSALKYAAKLDKENTLYASLQADMLRASVALVRKQNDVARQHLGRLIEEPTGAWHIGAVVARRHLGKLVGGEEGGYLVAEAEEQMLEEGIQNMPRMSTLVAPGPPSS